MLTAIMVHILMLTFYIIIVACLLFSYDMLLYSSMHTSPFIFANVKGGEICWLVLIVHWDSGSCDTCLYMSKWLKFGYILSQTCTHIWKHAHVKHSDMFGHYITDKFRYIVWVIKCCSHTNVHVIFEDWSHTQTWIFKFVKFFLLP